MVFNEVLPILNIFHLPLDPTIYFLLYVGHLDIKYFITGILLIICYTYTEFLLALKVFIKLIHIVLSKDN